MEHSLVMDCRQDLDGLLKDVAGLRLWQGTTPRDVVEQILARCRAFEHEQEAVFLFEVVDQVDDSVNVGQPLKQHDLCRKKTAAYLSTITNNDKNPQSQQPR